MQKTINIEGLEEPVLLVKRRGTRSLKISIKSDGRVRVSVPYGMPEIAARTFVRSKLGWIQKHTKPAVIIPNNSHIGKSHRLSIETSDASRHSTKVSNTDIVVRLPAEMNIEDKAAQKIIKKACEKALLIEAEKLLPQRLDHISRTTKIEFNKSTVKRLKSRWGACDNHSNITLNSYLIQLDWKLIDYVIYHELTHTRHPHHQKDFWEQVALICPDYKNLRRQLKAMPTDVIPTLF